MSMRAVAVSVAGITAVFLISFIGAVLEGDWDADWQGASWIVAAAVMAMVAGRQAPSGWPAAAGGVVALLSWIAWIYGAYSAHLTGWGGLDVSEFGSDDQPGHRWIFLTTMGLALPILAVGAVLGLVGTFRR
jgi:hypothetical protein